MVTDPKTHKETQTHKQPYKQTHRQDRLL